MNRVVRKLLGPKRHEVTADRGSCIKRASWFVLLAKCYSGDQTKEGEMRRKCGMCGAEERCVQGSDVLLERRIPLARARYGLEDNIKVDLKK